MTKQKNRMLSLALVVCMTSSPACANTPTPDANPPTAATGAWMKITGGCLGGGLVGSVVPVIGNIIGCAAGGLATWWWGKRTTAAPTRPAALNQASANIRA